MTSPGNEIRASNDGAKRWIDKVPRDGVPKTDKLTMHSRDHPLSFLTVRFSCQRRTLNLWKSDLESAHKPKYQILSIHSRGQE